MAGRGNPFPQNYSTSDSSESSSFSNPILEEKWKEHLYFVDNEVVNDLRSHTREYVKSIGGLPIIPNLPSCIGRLSFGWRFGRIGRNSLVGSC